MLRHVFTLAVILAVALFVIPVGVLAEEKPDVHEGTIVKAADGKLTIADKEKKEHTCDVAKDAKITCDGKECKLEDLKKGVTVKVTIKEKKATVVAATTK